MRKKLILALIILTALLLLAVPVFAQDETPTGVVAGRIVNRSPDGLRLAEIYILSNTGDRTIAGITAREDAQFPLQFPLPEGATNISFNENSGGGRFVLTPGGFADTAPLRPGESTNQVVVTYLLPYEDGLTYSWIAPWPVESLSFMLNTATGLSLEGENLTPSGTRDMGEGGQVDVFSHGALGPGENVTVSLSGTLLQPLVAPAGDMASEVETGAGFSSKKGLALGGAALGLALMAVGVWWYRRPEPEEIEEEEDGPEASFDQLVTQIARLDEAHDRGDINGSDYARQRAQMVRQATDLLARSTEQDATSPSGKRCSQRLPAVLR
jgi:hypothetical protein